MSTSANIRLEGVTVDFPIYSARTRSLKTSLLHKGTGGRIGNNAESVLCVRALEDVSLTIEHGDRVGLVGRNGSGKTTLLRVLAGVYEPPQGRVWRQGRVTSLFDVGLGIDHETTGYENIMTCGLLLGLTPEEIQNRMEEIAAFSELGEYLDIPVRTYSTGMLMRLTFAVCTCIKPEILLMDEWLSVGDAAFVEKAERRLEAFIDRAGILVLASHDLDLLGRVCTKGILLDAGRVRTSGPIEDVTGEYGRVVGV